MKLKKERLRWPHSQDEIISRYVHVLGFVYGKQEMSAHVVVPSSSAHPVAIWHEEPQLSLWMIRHGMLQEDSSKNDDVLKSIYFSHVEKF